MTDIPIRCLATNHATVDRINQLIRERDEIHGQLVLARWALDRMVRDNERQVRKLRETIAKQERELDRIMSTPPVRPADVSDEPPVWLQINPLPRGIR